LTTLVLGELIPRLEFGQTLGVAEVTATEALAFAVEQQVAVSEEFGAVVGVLAVARALEPDATRAVVGDGMGVGFANVRAPPDDAADEVPGVLVRDGSGGIRQQGNDAPSRSTPSVADSLTTPRMPSSPLPPRQ
jgi:hypothetical protein